MVDRETLHASLESRQNAIDGLGFVAVQFKELKAEASEELTRFFYGARFKKDMSTLAEVVHDFGAAMPRGGMPFYREIAHPDRDKLFVWTFSRTHQSGDANPYFILANGHHRQRKFSASLPLTKMGRLRRSKPKARASYGRENFTIVDNPSLALAALDSVVVRMREVLQLQQQEVELSLSLPDAA